MRKFKVPELNSSLFTSLNICHALNCLISDINSSSLVKPNTKKLKSTVPVPASGKNQFPSWSDSATHGDVTLSKDTLLQRLGLSQCKDEEC